MRLTKTPITLFFSIFILAIGMIIFQKSLLTKASSTSWNFSNTEFKSLGTISATKNISNLTLGATSAKPMNIQSNTKTLDGVTYNYSLNLNGQGNTTYRFVKIPISQNSTLKVVLMSNGSVERNLLVADTLGNTLTTFSAGTTIKQLTYKYTKNEGYIYLYSSNSGINLFKIQVDSASTTTTTAVASTTKVTSTAVVSTSSTKTASPVATSSATATPSSTTSSGVPSGYSVVDASGNGNYKTVQAAINASKTKIYIKAGTYKEVITISSSLSGITIVGENPATTILTYDNYSGKNNGKGGTYGTGGSASFFAKGSNLTLKNVTISNSYVEQGNSGEQAVSLYASGSKIAFYNCRITGNQDTLCLYGGTQYFEKCYIAGDVDFIFGNSQAYFQNCTICSLNRNSSSNNGYITAASTLATKTYGFVFNSCSLTCATNTASKSVHLGRPWCPSGIATNKAAVAFLNCSMGAHIKDAPWTSMSGVSASHGRFYEYKSTGSGAVINSSRPQLSDSTATNYTKSNVLDGWNPSF